MPLMMLNLEVGSTHLGLGDLLPWFPCVDHLNGKVYA